VVFSGGVDFTEKDFSALSESEKALFSVKAADKIKKADMSVKYPDYRITDTLFTGNGVMNVARFPNKYSDGSDQLIGPGSTVDGNHILVSYSQFKNKIRNYHSVDGLYFYGYISTGWYKDLVETAGYTVDSNGDLCFLIPHPEKTRGGYLRPDPWFDKEYLKIALVNVSEELDANGEFFVDTDAKTLYVYDPAGTYSFIEDACAVDMDHTDYITFRGLTFTSFGDAGQRKGCMINGDFCHGITVDRCTVAKCSGDNAIRFDGCGEGRDLDIRVTDCTFSVFANHALRVVGESLGTKKFNRRSNVLIDNNLFEYTNLTVDDGCGVTVMYCNEAVVSHNEFENNSRGAIDYGGCSNCVIEYNSFRNIMYNSSDGGVLYSWNRHEDWGNVIRYNVFFPCPWYGVYIDDDEPGTTVTRNIFFSQNAVVVHDGRNNKMNENIMIDSGFSVTPGNCEAVEKAKASGDIESLKDNKYYGQWADLFADFVKYPEIEAGFRKNFPEVFDLSVDLADIDAPSFVLNPVNEIKGNAFFTAAGRDYEIDLYKDVRKWVAVEDNKSFDKTENPYFVNPSAGDYRMREDADFPDLHFESIGRY
ncbi:MAG: right-handed parallel beta-helix repeat-containing protein, partial [Clostridia bacterium]|nr:right-handed parallel beta-helix repeat-containing protein [Clostridia bacterium]